MLKMPTDQDTFWMEKALTQAQNAFEKNEVPIGAVIVQNNMVLSEAYNLRETTQDPLGHAEMRAIQMASKQLNTWRLIDSTLYVTVEPCLMCAGAILQSRISSIVYGCKDKKAGAVDSLYHTLSDDILNHRVNITSGVLEHACRHLMQTFFEKLRTEPV